MAGLQIDVSIDRNAFAQYADAVAPSSLLKLIGIRFTSFLTDRFENNGESDEFSLPGWVPLKPSTIAMRRNGSSRPLQDTGQLKQSYLGQPATDNQTYVEVGSNKEYASYHEEGTAPYEIHVKSARMLAAKLSAGGWVIFGKRVRHPGLPARPVLPSRAIAEAMMVEEFESMLEPLGDA